MRICNKVNALMSSEDDLYQSLYALLRQVFYSFHKHDKVLASDLYGIYNGECVARAIVNAQTDLPLVLYLLLIITIIIIIMMMTILKLLYTVAIHHQDIN